MDYDFHPFTKPNDRKKIKLPTINTIIEAKRLSYKIDDTGKNNLVDEFNIETDKLKEGKDSYNIFELKEIANNLNIENYTKMNKGNLIKFIKLKLDL